MIPMQKQKDILEEVKARNTHLQKCIEFCLAFGLNETLKIVWTVAQIDKLQNNYCTHCRSIVEHHMSGAIITAKVNNNLDDLVVAELRNLLL